MDITDRRTPLLIFDGDCGFCTSASSWLADRLARRDGLDAVLAPWQLIDLSAVGTTTERAQRELLWVTPSGEIFGGVQAFAQWLRYPGRWTRVAGTALTLPGIRAVAAGIYRLVVRNRHRMPGGTPACALQPPVRRADCA